MSGSPLPAEPNLYVHVPFCAGKCAYCAFYSEGAFAPGDVRDYLALLPRELALRGLSGMRPQTVYVGGGTPSQLGADGIRALFAALPPPAPDAEVTVEANPADMTPALAGALRECGVTRVSLGAQSFSAATLARLGRRHGPDAIRQAAALVRAAGIGRLSLDLIAATPGELDGEFQNSLQSAIALEPDHVSVYPLSVEPGTPFANAGVRPPSDEDALAAVALAEETLGAAGFSRYELSNYARPGAECRHNLAVWLGEDYVGAGPAACSRMQRLRRANAPGFHAWRDALRGDELPPAQTETLSVCDDEAERFSTRVRLREWALPAPDSDIGRRRAATLARLAELGLAHSPKPGIWSLTARGREVADSVAAELL